MRDNTRAILALPEFSSIESPTGEKWGLISATPARLLEIRKLHANTPNEQEVWGTDSEWLGLGTQPLHDALATGIAQYPLRLTRETIAAIPQKRSRFAEPRAAISGGFWDVPSVLANLPQSARTRVRNKLPPKHFKLILRFSAMVDPATMSKKLATLISAMWAYTQAGGVCRIDIAYGSRIRASEAGYAGLVCRFTLNASDLSACATAVSVAFFRAFRGPIATAFSDAPYDGLPPLTASPLPGYLFIGGESASHAYAAFDKIAKELELSGESR